MQKRFTYWTEDGERHWAPFLGICIPESELPLPDILVRCRNRSELRLPHQSQDDQPKDRHDGHG